MNTIILKAVSEKLEVKTYVSFSHYQEVKMRILIQRFLVFVCLGWFGLSEAQTYDLPFKGEDMNPGERILWGRSQHSNSGVQKYGYDLAAVKYSKKNNNWLENSGSANNKYYLYNKPVYAMRSGKIIACWRNAPENPTSGARHPELGDTDRKTLDTRIYGGGNGMWIEHSDGSRAEYAHFRSGTVPSSLCSHNASLFANKVGSPNVDLAWPEIRVPATQQVQVQAGQFLGRVGNSGTSSNTHLHIHVEQGGTAGTTKSGGNPVKINFRRGLSAPTSAKGVYTTWTSFAGKPIPPGPVLIWPPLTRKGEYTRHGISLKTHRNLHTWLAESGFWPAHTDIYTVSGKPYINATWRPAKSGWLAYHTISGNDHQKTFGDATKNGFSLAQVDSTIINGKVRYMSFYKKDRAKVMAGHGMTLTQFNTLQVKAKKAKYHPISVSIVPVRNSLSYTALYRPKGPSNWSIEPSINSAQYQAVYNTYADKGRHPMFVNSYRRKNGRFFCVIFGNRNNSGIDRHDMTSNQVQTTFDSALTAGLKTGGVAGYDGAKKDQRFIGFWR